MIIWQWALIILAFSGAGVSVIVGVIYLLIFAYLAHLKEFCNGCIPLF